MEKEKIYTPMEEVLVAAAKWVQTKENMEKALQLDLLLLEMEEQQGLIDGKELQEWIL